MPVVTGLHTSVLNQGVTAFEVMLPGLFPRLIIPYIKFQKGVKWKGGCKSARRGNAFAVGNYGPSVVLNLSHLFTSPEDFFNKQVELKYTEEGKRLPFSIVQQTCIVHRLWKRRQQDMALVLSK